MDHQTSITHVTATTQDENASISVNGTTVASGVASNAIELDIPTSNISVVVTAEDGSTTRGYTVKVTRCGPDDLIAVLSFFAETFYCPGNFTTYAEFSTTSIQVTATATNPGATVTVNGTEVASGAISTQIALDVGWNRIEIAVTAEDGVTERNHRIDVLRYSPDFSLSMTGASLVPEFSWTVTDYAAVVGFLTDSTRITATSTDPDAVITVNGTEVASGVASDPIPLDMGANTITVAVTAEEGVLTESYTIVVTRAEATSLIGLSMTGVSLEPAFSPSVTDYTSMTGYQVTSTRITATASDPNATITINGTGVVSGVESEPVELAAGSNTITVNVTPENGTITNTYTVVVTRPSALDFVQQAYVKASNTDGNDRFGSSLSLSADGFTLAVGAMGEDSAAIGVNSDEANDVAESAGAVYVLTRDSTDTWTQRAYVKASNTDRDDKFGHSVALSGDGTTLAVGATGEDSATTRVNGDEASNTGLDAGAAYIFTRDSGSVWTQQAYLKPSNTDVFFSFGSSVALTDDGSTLAVGAPGEASAASGPNSDQTDTSASDAGAVYVFTRGSGGVWTQQAYVKASNTDAGDAFGTTVALSADGATLAVGATGEDAAATGVDGDQTDSSAEDAGAVYVFVRGSGGVWTQQAYVKASNTAAGDEFGSAVALSADGSMLVVGATGENAAATGVNGDQADTSASDAGAVYVFTRGSGGVWIQQAYVKASNTNAGDVFGTTVALSSEGSTLAVGASGESSAATGVNGDEIDNSFPNAGAVYVFTLDSADSWTQRAYLKASAQVIASCDCSEKPTVAASSRPSTVHMDLDCPSWCYYSGNRFGHAVALSADGANVAVGAPAENSGATSVNGDESDISGPGSGAAYFFEL